MSDYPFENLGCEVPFCNLCMGASGSTSHTADECPMAKDDTPEFKQFFKQVEVELHDGMQLKHRPITPYLILKAVLKVQEKQLSSQIELEQTIKMNFAKDTVPICNNCFLERHETKINMEGPTPTYQLKNGDYCICKCHA